MIVVDSSVWIDYFNGVPNAATDKLDALLGIEPLAIGDVILMEVLQGFRRDTDHEVARRLMGSLFLLDMLGEAQAMKCAQNYRRLRQAGHTVRKTVDVIIATYCVEHGLPLLFQDKDFRPFVTHLGLQAVLR